MASLRIPFARDSRGATAIEYSVVAMLLAIGLIAALGAFGDTLLETFGIVEAEMPAGAIADPAG